VSASQNAYAWLLDALRRGVYAPGSRPPGAPPPPERIGVSRSTLRQALTHLAEDGLLTASSQRGWYVTRQLLGEPPSVLQSFTEMAAARGLRATSRILRQVRRPAAIEEATRLRIAPSAPVLEVRRVRGMDGAPMCVDTTVLVAARAAVLETANLTDRSLYEALLSECGVQVARSAYAVQAQAADAELGELLVLPVGAPVLVGEETTYDAEGVPVLLSRTVYRGDAYRFEADLFRPLN